MNTSPSTNSPTIHKTNTQLFNKSTSTNVSDREFLRIIKEEKNFPISFSKRVKLPQLLKAYHKYWYCDYTDESDTDK